MNVIRKSVTLDNGQTIELEHGRLAKQADGAVVLKTGDTMLLATVVANKEFDPDFPFLPLSVDYREKFSGSGRIPGGFLKREARPNDHEVLTSRIIDRSIRPMFPDGYKPEIQVIVQLISSDIHDQPDALALVAGMAAIMTSDIPFEEPVCSVRVGYKDGEYVINPPFDDAEKLELDLIVSGTADNITMVEGEAKEVSEEIMTEALKTAHESIKKLNAVMEDIRKEAGKTIREFDVPAERDDVRDFVREQTSDKINSVIHKHDLGKFERSSEIKAIKDEMVEALKEKFGEEAVTEEKLDDKAKSYFKDLQSELVRKMILDEGVRLDGRKGEDIRDVWCEVDYLPRAHGSSVFTRGETQSLTTVTFGTKLDEKIVDQATESGYKKFMLQYSFPPYCTGEVKFLRGPARREIGHGNLAERAVKGMVPEDNPYTLRVTSEVLESNGSSSMATVCAASLAMMDAGIKLKRAISGIAMGLIVEGDKYAILTDILGDEDHLGDMDFKLCGTREGITACQMDIKVRGLSYEVLGQALAQARDARLRLLDIMDETIAEAREDYKEFVPRIVRMEVAKDYIGAIIGKGGETIQGLQEETNTTITIDEVDGKGIIHISSANGTDIEKAKERIEQITYEPEVGEVFTGKVVNIRESGAFVEFLPGKDGYLHISEVAWEHIPSMESVLSTGDEVEVMYVGIDKRNGKHRLSRKRLLDKPEGYEERPRGGGGGRGGDRRGGGRGGDRRGGGRGGNRGGGRRD